MDDRNIERKGSYLDDEFEGEMKRYFHDTSMTSEWM